MDDFSSVAAQYINGVLLGSFPRRVSAEQNPHKTGDHQCRNNTYRRIVCGHVGIKCDQTADTHPQQDTQNTAHTGQKHRFDKELEQYIAFLSSQCPAGTDLFTPLVNACQHDVHNTDTADDQRDPGNGTHYDSKDILRSLPLFQKIQWYDHIPIFDFAVAGAEVLRYPVGGVVDVFKLINRNNKYIEVDLCDYRHGCFFIDSKAAEQ